MKTITITQTRSTIGALQKHKRTMEALGLRKINQSVTHKHNSCIAGMVKHVYHLIKIV